MIDLMLQAKESLLFRRAAVRRLFQENEGAQTAPEPERDWPERAAAQKDGALLNRLSETERLELMDIDAALARIERGTYGMCEGCGAAIGRLRLRALPETRFCIACSERLALSSANGRNGG
jgi:RNA polymerase-binding transcription factor DksA